MGRRSPDGKALNETAARRADRRTKSRIEDRQHVAIITKADRLICDLTDISEAGARLSIVSGTMPAEGEALSLTLFDGTSVPSIVSWTKHDALGLKFLKPLGVVEAHLVLEELGGDFYRRAVQLQKRLSQT